MERSTTSLQESCSPAVRALSVPSADRCFEGDRRDFCDAETWTSRAGNSAVAAPPCCQVRSVPLGEPSPKVTGHASDTAVTLSFAIV